MAWTDPDGWLTRSLGPSISTIIITALIALSLPVFLHLYIYRSRAPASLPTFLLIGPSGSGKTSLLTLFEKGTPSPTHVSQTPLSVEVALPATTTAASSKYRSEHDAEAKARKQLLLIDTPGHGKLRHFARQQLDNPQHLKGIIFVVDAANLSSGTGGRADEGLTEAAEYLHDILMTLQKRYTSARTSKGPKEMPVLIAANKLDLFTALPAPLVKTALEGEITKVRVTRSKGLMAVGINDEAADEEREWLGDGGEGKFEFKQMGEVNVHVDVIGGSVLGSDGPDVGKWWDWIAQQV